VATARWRQISDVLLAKIEEGEYKAGDRLPTSAQLAEQSGVSLLTAHKALDELQRSGYVDRAGRRGTIVTDRKKTKTGRIAFIVDQIDFVHNFPRPELLDKIHAGLGGEYNLVICDSKASVEREIELLGQMAEETDGILCWPTGDEKAAPAIAELVAKKTPLVLLDRIPGNVHADAVLTDSVPATEQAAEFLIRRGHKRVALLTFDKPEISTVLERCGTFERIMDQHGILAPELVRKFPASLEVKDRTHFDQVFHDAIFTLLNAPSPATAILCVQDLLGVAVLKFVEEQGLSIPDDLEVVTFNDWPAHWLGRPWQAHRIAVQPGDMGRTAIGRLLAQIAGDAGEPGTHHIPTMFIPADSLVGSVYDLNRQRPLEVQ
jgi:DNA-binding LacI/PurR family transcriptional regulator